MRTPIEIADVVRIQEISNDCSLHIKLYQFEQQSCINNFCTIFKTFKVF